jgi:hypothetical protein
VFAGQGQVGAMGVGWSDLQSYWRRAAVLMAAGVLVSGCSSDPASPTAPSSSSSFPSLTSFTSFMSNSPPPTRAATPGAWQPSVEEDCPIVQIRTGASTLPVSVASAQPSPQDLRYQLTFVQMARQCAVVGANMRMRIGVQGRAIVGPAGAPNQIEAPVRYAVVREGVTPKVIITKLRRISVPMPPGTGNVAFSDIEEDLSFPIPTQKELEAYVVYVGFDDQAAERQPPAKKAPARKQ